MNNNMLESELYNKTKSGVERKLLLREKNKRRVVISLLLVCLFISVNVTAYASSKEYRNWLSTQLGLTTENIISVEKNVTGEKINMKVLSYYRVNNTVVMSMSFTRNDGQKFEEELNVEYLNIEKTSDSSGEILSSYSYLSEDEKNVLILLTMNVDTQKIKMKAENLITMTTGECLYLDNWTLEIDVSEQTGTVKKLAETDSAFIQVNDKEYSVKEIYEIGNALFFKCDVNLKEMTEEDKLRSVYGGNVILEYEDGTTNDSYYCIPDKDDNLVLSVWDINHLKNISRIYIDGEKVLESLK